MTKKLSVLLGIGLIGLGGLALVGNLVFPAMGIDFRWWEFWRLWPVLVLSVGLLFNAVPFMARSQRGWGAFFIAGIPILVTGGILLFCSLFNAWGAWSFLWPLEPLSLGLGFTFAALWMRSTGLVFPAILISLNGFVLAFCNTTGWWETWSVLWAVEPLSIGLAFLVMGVRKSNKAVVAIGLGFCGFAAVAAFGMSMLMLTGWWVMRYLWPLIFIFTGIAVIVCGGPKELDTF
jgi:hypothetical protein